MTPNRWIELFFLDEATAFAAGYRPCGFCRHTDFKLFKNLWLEAKGEKYGLMKNVKMDVIDNIIHKERLDENNIQKTFSAYLQTLPDGVLIKVTKNENAYHGISKTFTNGLLKDIKKLKHSIKTKWWMY
jgi:methylphosphotriester-DNA--protein-cysteine methyltransferase